MLRQGVPLPQVRELQAPGLLLQELLLLVLLHQVLELLAPGLLLQELLLLEPEGRLRG